jgi:DNA polymerase III delta prime subunit
MTEEILIRKYKPYYLQEFGLDKKRMQLLRTLYEIEDINILLVGSQSAGKTTMLYTMIREYYNLKKENTIPETNILFINQLKEQGIHYFRNEMKTFCQSKSTIRGKKKMIVIDDIDNLNEQSQQVFRNYIDKYKRNIHMICSCTNIQKVIESIQSRLHIINLEMPTNEEIVRLLMRIKEEMQIKISEKAMEKIKTTIKKENENIVQMISKMEKMYIYQDKDEENNNNKEIELEELEKMTSHIKKEDLAKYIENVKKGNLKEAIHILQKMEGYSVIDILDHLYNHIKETEELDETTKYEIIPLLCKYITIFNKIHEDHIELAIFTNELIEVTCRERKMR